MHVDRFNAWARISGAPAWFLNRLVIHLSVPVEPDTELGFRFGCLFTAPDPTTPGLSRRWGSLVKQDTVPAGLVPYVEHYARAYQLPCHVNDHRTAPECGYPLFSVHPTKWRPYQDQVHEQVLRHPCGIIDAPPRSGKTLMAARVLDTLNVRSVYIAPSVQIVRQTYEVFVSHFGEDLVARIDGDASPHQKNPEKQFVVATPQSALALGQTWWERIECLVIDEFHHSAADTYHRINAAAGNAYFRYGFTGTHFRSGDDRLAMEAVCSHVLFKIPVDYLVSNGWLAVPRVLFGFVGAKPTGGQDFRTAYQRGIVECEERNALVAHLGRSLVDAGVPTLVLTRRRKHADELAERIGSDAVAVKGGENSLTSSAVRDFLKGRFGCLVGTNVIGEGVDVPRAAALVYASGGNDGVQMMQSYFRPLTSNGDKQAARIFDFLDSHHGQLRKHSERRVEMARGTFGQARVITAS